MTNEVLIIIKIIPLLKNENKFCKTKLFAFFKTRRKKKKNELYISSSEK